MRYSVTAARDGEMVIDSVEADDQDAAESEARRLIAGVFTSIPYHPDDEAEEFVAELDGFDVDPDPEPADIIATNRCPLCNSPLRREVFTGPHIDGEAVLWICSQNAIFGGLCRSNTAYLQPTKHDAQMADLDDTFRLLDAEEHIVPGLNDALKRDA